MEDKIHIYFMPGLAASSRIFEYIKVADDKFALHHLEWLEPESEKESLAQYAAKYVNMITHKRPVLIGVSFGGILVQEIGRLMDVRKIIIVSSVKNEDELPKRLKYLRKSRIYKLFPSKRLSKIDDFSKYNFHPQLKKKGELYNKYLSIRNEKYLNWAIHNMLHWKNNSIEQDLMHIHGTRDEIFPIKYVKDCIPVEGGTHAMIIVKAKKISAIIENLLPNDT
jgi:pimeloyl-ACP methyl ester carboxylesterase